MSRPPLPADATALLEKPNPAVMATIRSDGAPVSTPTWYLWEDGAVLLNLDGDRARLQHLRRDPRVTLTVLDESSWYTHVTLIGHVSEIRADEGLADINRISRHYTGGDYPEQGRERFTAVMTVDRWHGWGAMKDNDRAAPGS
ncbi:MAG: PPOX class F420-dependent enzyme [Nocardioides sp.]|nr:PPOX class F420-dependent enzyme [Nocardioides sp.]